MGNEQHRQCAFEPLPRPYYSPIGHCPCRRLDNETEAERPTRETLHIAAAIADRGVSFKADKWFLSLAVNLLHRQWLKARYQNIDKEYADVADDCTVDLQDQAAALYLRLRTLRNNSAATAEASAAIHHWIGSDSLRHDVYERVRMVLYHQRKPRSSLRDVDVFADAIPGLSPKEYSSGRRTTPTWTDVALLLLVFLLLLPLIYFLAVPAG